MDKPRADRLRAGPCCGATTATWIHTCGQQKDTSADQLGGLSLACLNWLTHYHPEPRAGTSDPVALDRPHRALADRSRVLVGEARRHGLLRARSTPLPNKPAAGLIVRWLNCLDVDVGQTPAQCYRDDHNHGDHAEVSGLLSSRRMLPHFRIHLKLSLKLLRHDLQLMLLARPSAV
jgi:hypothetical protein